MDLYQRKNAQSGIYEENKGENIMSKDKHLIHVKKHKKKSVTDYLTKYMSRGSSDCGYFSTEEEPVFVTLTTDRRNKSGLLDHVELHKAFSNFKEKLQNYSEDVWGCYKTEFNSSGHEYIHFVAGGNDVPSANSMKKVWNYCVNKVRDNGEEK